MAPASSLQALAARGPDNSAGNHAVSASTVVDKLHLAVCEGLLIKVALRGVHAVGGDAPPDDVREGGTTVREDIDMVWSNTRSDTDR